MDGDHPFLSRCVVSFSFMVCSGHHALCELLSLLRLMNISPSQENKKIKQKQSKQRYVPTHKESPCAKEANYNNSTGRVADKCYCSSNRPSTSPDGDVTDAKMLLWHQRLQKPKGKKQGSGKQPQSCWNSFPVTN